jgi:hypothetical protein
LIPVPRSHVEFKADRLGLDQPAIRFDTLAQPEKRQDRQDNHDDADDVDDVIHAHTPPMGETIA